MVVSVPGEAEAGVEEAVRVGDGVVVSVIVAGAVGVSVKVGVWDGVWLGVAVAVNVAVNVGVMVGLKMGDVTVLTSRPPKKQSAATKPIASNSI